MFFFRGPLIIVNQPCITTDSNLALQVGDTINPFVDAKVSSYEDVEVYLVFDCYSLDELDDEIVEYGVLKCKDEKVIKDMIENWNFIFQHRDAGTHGNVFAIYGDGKLLFSCAIELIPSNEMLQSADYGWVVPLQKGVLIKACSQFEPVLSPIVIFPKCKT